MGCERGVCDRGGVRQGERGCCEKRWVRGGGC